jgi:hypothetical protein
MRVEPEIPTRGIPREVAMNIDVTVKIPEERVGQFYELVGRWLSGEQLVGEEADEPATTPKNWTNSDEDLVLARLVWGKFSLRAKAMLSVLMDHPEHKVSAEDLAATLHIPNGKSGVAGVLAWPARHCAAVKRGLLWHWEDGAEGGGADYWVDQEIAELFNQVRN